MTEKENEVQGNEPLWKQQGFESPEEAFEAISTKVDELETENVAEKARADTLEKEVNKGVTPRMPKWDPKAFDADPEGYQKKYNDAMESYQSAVEAGQGKPSKATLEATINSVLAQAAKKGYDEDVIQGTIRSMVRRDPSKRVLLDSPDGIRELGKQAMEKLKGQSSSPTKEKPKVDDNSQEDDDMGDRVPQEHLDRPGRASTGPRQSAPKTSEVERLDNEIREGVEKKTLRGDKLVDKIIERNLARLGHERPKR